jgi:hypothetical protein
MMNDFTDPDYLRMRDLAIDLGGGRRDAERGTRLDTFTDPTDREIARYMDEEGITYSLGANGRLEPDWSRIDTDWSETIRGRVRRLPRVVDIASIS